MQTMSGISVPDFTPEGTDLDRYLPAYLKDRTDPMFSEYRVGPRIIITLPSCNIT